MQIVMTDVCCRAAPMTLDLSSFGHIDLPEPFFDLTDDDIEHVLDGLAERGVAYIGEIEFRETA